MSSGNARLGTKVRALRRKVGLTQAKLAEQLGISASYLNLIENQHRPLTAPLLIKLAERFDLDLSEFGSDNEARLISELMEVFGDPLFDDEGLTQNDVRELAAAAPNAARAVLSLYRRFQETKENAQVLATRLADEGAVTLDRPLLPSEEVTDLIQQHGNHFPELEAAADALHAECGLAEFNRYVRLGSYLEDRHGVRVEVAPGGGSPDTLRRYDPQARVLTVSEVLPPRSRHFALAHQIAHIEHRALLDRIVEGGPLTTNASRALARLALANYFAAAVLMPYERFHQAAQETRYDIESLGHRFRTSFEQICHRLTTLRRPGAEGIPFHFLRVDIAGNISKRFSGSGIRFARYSGACPLWNVFRAFLTPGLIRTQLSQMPDGTTYFCIARTVHTASGGFHAPKSLYALGLGCDVKYASQMVYADGVDLNHLGTAVPIGVTCRLCERTDCAQRAFPPVQRQLVVDENRRGVT